MKASNEWIVYINSDTRPDMMIYYTTFSGANAKGNAKDKAQELAASGRRAVISRDYAPCFILPAKGCKAC